MWHYDNFLKKKGRVPLVVYQQPIRIYKYRNVSFARTLYEFADDLIIRLSTFALNKLLLLQLFLTRELPGAAPAAPAGPLPSKSESEYEIPSLHLYFYFEEDEFL